MYIGKHPTAALSRAGLLALLRRHLLRRLLRRRLHGLLRRRLDGLLRDLLLRRRGLHLIIVIEKSLRYIIFHLKI